MVAALLLALISAGGCTRQQSRDEAPLRESGVVVARLDLDLEQGRLQAARGARQHETRFDPASVSRRLDELWTELSSGGLATAERIALGTELLGPADSLLADARRWRVRVGPWPGALPRAALLGSLVPPWSAGAPVAERHALDFAPPGGFAAPDSSRSDGDGARADGRLLLVAPFRSELGEIGDDADTLRVALRRATRAVDLVPRNDTTAPTLTAVLEQGEHRLLWVRATPAWWRTHVGSLHPLPPVIVWSQPGGLPVADPRSDALRGALAAIPGTAEAVIVQLWPCSEERASALVAGLARALADDLPLAEALARARSESLVSARPRVWAPWVLVGDGSIHAPLDRGGWLR